MTPAALVSHTSRLQLRQLQRRRKHGHKKAERETESFSLTIAADGPFLQAFSADFLSSQSVHFTSLSRADSSEHKSWIKVNSIAGKVTDGSDKSAFH